MKDRLNEADYTQEDAPEDHLKTNVNAAHMKLSEYYKRLEDSPIYYAATVPHPHYKHALEHLWKIPEDYSEEAEGQPHPYKDWLPSGQQAFL